MILNHATPVRVRLGAQFIIVLLLKEVVIICKEIGIFEAPEGVNLEESKKIDRINRGEQLSREEQNNLQLASCDDGCQPSLEKKPSF